MMCAIEAGKRGRSVLLIDHATKLAEKIRISGGGRCNFTNTDVTPQHFVSSNPNFCRSALARYTPQDFIALVEKHRLRYHEKKLGQLFCDDGSQRIIEMLKRECDAASVQWWMPCAVQRIVRDAGFVITTNRGDVQARSLVIATGGLSIPQIGATPFGYRIAQEFGIGSTELRPGLVPLLFGAAESTQFSGIAGVSFEATVRCNGACFRENVLVTHRGLSGPAILQISSYWRPGGAISIDLLPDHDGFALLQEQRRSRSLLTNLLSDYLPKRFVHAWLASFTALRPIDQYADRELKAIADRLHDWQIRPSGTAGYKKAEVTVGGVDTRALSSKSMESSQVPGLFFIGEVVDVTGHLGGFNFQWAWASGFSAGQYV